MASVNELKCRLAGLLWRERLVRDSPGMPDREYRLRAIRQTITEVCARLYEPSPDALPWKELGF